MKNETAPVLSWLPTLSTPQFLGLIAGCVLVWLLLRMLRGHSIAGRRLDLVLLRLFSLGLLAVILFGPTMVDEQPGEISRPAVMMVFDGSQSMQLGQQNSRWDAATAFAQDAREDVAAIDSENCRTFQFGHQLQPLTLTNVETSEEAIDEDAAEGPASATDSRLADALRQLLPQATAEDTSGVVLFSDGRVRATDTVEKLASVFGESQIPIHVVPVGEARGAGDVAVVSMVVPSSVRKFTENEMQVFLRSFGYEGQEATVQVRRQNGEQTGKVLAEVPVTLQGGPQSVSLTFRVDEHPEDLEVAISPLPDELTVRNNIVTTSVGINRTKIRVLYVEGDPDEFRSSTRMEPSSFGFGMLDVITLDGSSRRTTTTQLNLRDALQADEDVECSLLVSFDDQPPVSVSSIEANLHSFPKTRAQLFAFDCVVLSNVGPNVLTDEQSVWLKQWVEGRGGGLVVTGSRALVTEKWADSPLASLLPIRLEDSLQTSSLDTSIEVTQADHPVFRLQLEEQLNRSMLQQIPELEIAMQGHSAKPSAQVLAANAQDGSPVMAGQRAGRGRVLVSTAKLTGRALSRLASTWGAQPERTSSKFWRNMVYWSTEASSTGRRRLIATSDKRFYRPGENLNIQATAYDEAARKSDRYRIWAMFEPMSLDDMSIYSPILWPENVIRQSGEVGPRIAWGEELQLRQNAGADLYELALQLSETGTSQDSGFRIEMTAYEGEEDESGFSHGTQVDSTSLVVRILNDPFEQQNPLPNHELLNRVASLSGGSVLKSPEELSQLLESRPQVQSASVVELSPAWDQWWLWALLATSLTVEWCRRRLTGLA